MAAYPVMWIVVLECVYESRKMLRSAAHADIILNSIFRYSVPTHPS
jgi:hypothetical protein